MLEGDSLVLLDVMKLVFLYPYYQTWSKFTDNYWGEGIIQSQKGPRPVTYATGYLYRSAGKSLARPGRKQATATEDFDVHISYL